MAKDLSKNQKKSKKQEESSESAQESENESSDSSDSEMEYSQENIELAEQELGSYSVESESESEESTKSGSNEEDDESKRTIYIKGIDYDLKEDELRDQMIRLGEVVRVNVPLTHDFRRNKGFAYVEFKNKQDAIKGLKLNDTELLGRKITVSQALPRSNKKIFTLFCKNLSYNTTKEEITNHFSKYGKIFNVSLPIDMSNSDRNKGFCFVEFNDEEAIKKALKGKNIINDRTLYVNEGNKNEERNEKRSSDRLYGRNNDREGSFREDSGFRRDGNNKRENNFRREDKFNEKRKYSDRYENKKRGGDNKDFKRNDERRNFRKDDGERNFGNKKTFNKDEKRSYNKKSFDNDKRFDKKSANKKSFNNDKSEKKDVKKGNKIIFDSD